MLGWWPLAYLDYILIYSGPKKTMLVILGWCLTDSSNTSWSVSWRNVPAIKAPPPSSASLTLCGNDRTDSAYRRVWVPLFCSTALLGTTRARSLLISQRPPLHTLPRQFLPTLYIRRESLVSPHHPSTASRPETTPLPHSPMVYPWIRRRFKLLLSGCNQLASNSCRGFTNFYRCFCDMFYFLIDISSQEALGKWRTSPE